MIILSAAVVVDEDDDVEETSWVLGESGGAAEEAWDGGAWREVEEMRRVAAANRMVRDRLVREMVRFRRCVVRIKLFRMGLFEGSSSSLLERDDISRQWLVHFLLSNGVLWGILL